MASLPKPLGNPEYRHLIDFVRPGHSGKCGRKKRAASPTPDTAINGDEARSFYEGLCQDKMPGDKVGISMSKRKCGSGYKWRHEKRTCHRTTDLCEVQSEVDLAEHVSAIGHAGVNYNDRTICSVKNETSAPVEIISSSSSGSASRPTSGCHSHATDKGEKLSQRVQDHRKSELLRLAQNGDNEGVKELLQVGTDVNSMDRFGWTAAMSAAFEGHVDVLQTLVKAGADLTISNSQGHTAVSLASQKHHTSAVNFIESFQRVGLIACKSKSREPQMTRFYCDVCKSEFTDTDQKTHTRSTVHIFNTGRKPKDDSFLIPPSNVGYRLMLKTGWDGSRGLGPGGQGQRFPVRTLLKRDRKGLGNTVTEKTKVTHFGAKDQSAVAGGHSQICKREANVRTLSRRAQRLKERRDRQREIELRRQLS